MQHGVSGAVSKTIGIIVKVILLLIFSFPFFWMISTSLQTLNEVNTTTPTFIPKVPQFQNYVSAWFFGPGLWSFLKNSVVIVASVIALQLVIMVPAAYAFARYEFRFKGVLFGLVLLALMMPTQITFLPIYLMMSKWELINALWPQIIPFMTDAFSIFLLRQYFMQVNQELIDAAHIDNCNEFDVMTKIMLPMAKPAIATIILFTFVGHWNDYFWPFVMTNNDAVRTLPLAIAEMKSMEGLSNWNIIMAGNCIMVVPIIIIYCFTSKQIIKSFAYSGIK